MFSQTEAPTGQRTLDNSTTFSGLWGSFITGCNIQKFACWRTTFSGLVQLRKPYLKACNSSKTVYSCKAEFTLSCGTLTSKKLREGPHIFAKQGLTRVSTPACHQQCNDLLVKVCACGRENERPRTDLLQVTARHLKNKSRVLRHDTDDACSSLYVTSCLIGWRCVWHHRRQFWQPIRASVNTLK